MSKPKGEERRGITFYLDPAELEQVDALCRAAVAHIPGAKLHRAGWVQQVVRRHLEGLRGPPPAKESAPPAKGKGR